MVKKFFAFSLILLTGLFMIFATTNVYAAEGDPEPTTDVEKTLVVAKIINNPVSKIKLKAKNFLTISIFLLL